MYRTAKGEEIFVIDGHTHFWDGSPANQKNIHGKQFIECFYAYHIGSEPAKEKLGEGEVRKIRRQDDVSTICSSTGYDDMAIVQPTYLTDFYKNGFNTTERNADDEEEPSGSLHRQRRLRSARRRARRSKHLHCPEETYDIKGVKLYTAEWSGDSKGYKLHRQGVLQILRGCAEARHQEHPRPQGSDDHPA